MSRVNNIKEALECINAHKTHGIKYTVKWEIRHRLGEFNKVLKVLLKDNAEFIIDSSFQYHGVKIVDMLIIGGNPEDGHNAIRHLFIKGFKPTPEQPE